MKLIILLGQTASGKSEMAVELAKELGNCWVASCDSRQVYKGLDLGTGKVEGRWQNNVFMYKNTPHYLIDYVGADTYYSLADYVLDWINLFNNKNLPDYVILAGGTGLYAKAIAEQYDLGIVKDEYKEELENYKANLQDLEVAQLQAKYNDQKGSDLNESDYHNPRRLQNWLLRSRAKELNAYKKLTYPKFESVHQFAIDADQEVLKNKIKTRLVERIDQGMLDEIKKVGEQVGGQRLIDLGLEYKVGWQYLSGEVGEEWVEKLNTEINQYAKRQLTWLKKQPLTWVKSKEDILKHILT